MNDWNLQSKRDILSNLDWDTTHFEVELKDGSIIKAWGFIDETGEGEIIEHLEELETGEYNALDTDEIVKWREWEPMNCR